MPSPSLLGQIVVIHEMLTTCLEVPIKKAGLTLSTFEMLSAVKAGGGRVSQADLAEGLGITPPSLSEALKSAEERGWIRREASASDRRVRWVGLTSEGEQKVGAVLSAFRELESQVSNRLSNAKQEAGAKALTDIQAVLEENLGSKS